MALSYKEFSVLDDADYIEICNLVLPWIFNKLNVSSLLEFDELGAQSIENVDLDIRYEMNIMTSIDYYLRRLITKLYGPVLFLQFPANIRVAGSEVPQGYMTKDYVTDRIHCDCWSQAPADSFNLFLYLHYRPGRPSLDFFTVPDSELPQLFSYKGPYSSAPCLTFQKIDTTPDSGQLYIFPTQTPHQTNRGEFGLRISLDARFRPLQHDFTTTPLFQELLHDYWLENRMTSLGVYWLFSDKTHFTLNEKIIDELTLSQAFDMRYHQKRLEYLDKFYSSWMPD